MMNDKFEARVISLEASLDRREQMTSTLKGFPLKWRFFDACNASSEAIYSVDPARQIRRFGRLLTPNEIGCFKSHLKVLDEFNENCELDWLLVLEDDLFVDVLFDYESLALWASARGLNYIRLYCRTYVPGRVVDRIGRYQVVRHHTDPYGAQAYLISRRGAESFKRSIKSIDMPIDDELGRFWLNGLPIYAIFPFPVLERSVPSTIEAGRDANPIRTDKFTIARNIDRTLQFGLKKINNAAFRLKLGK